MPNVDLSDLLERVRALPSYDLETVGGWNPYQTMVEQQRWISEDTGEEYYAGDWLKRDEVIKLIQHIDREGLPKKCQ